MTPQSQQILKDFQIRKSKRQKETFRAWLCEELEKAGYAPRVEKEKSLVESHNVVVGDPEKAEILFTAHYDTCAVLPFPNFVTPRNMLVYTLYQLLLCLGFFALAFGGELALLMLWNDAPMWLCLAVPYGVCIFCVWWMLDGKANKHTANDNTSGVVTLVETALALPEEYRDRVCFVFFDNEEKGLFGSGAFARRHRTVKRDKLLLNFDCVSDGDYIQLYPAKALKKDAAALERLEDAFRGRGEKTAEVVRGFAFYPSDQRAFRLGVGVCALKKQPVIGYYMNRIHTRRDTVLEEENIRLLRDGALRLAGWRTEKTGDFS